MIVAVLPTVTASISAAAQTWVHPAQLTQQCRSQATKATATMLLWPRKVITMYLAIRKAVNLKSAKLLRQRKEALPGVALIQMALYSRSLMHWGMRQCARMLLSLIPMQRRQLRQAVPNMRLQRSTLLLGRRSITRARRRKRISRCCKVPMAGMVLCPWRSIVVADLIR